MRREDLLKLIKYCVAFLALGLIAYFIQFHSGFSRNSSDWSNFATFINLFLSVISVVLLSTISFITLRASERYNQLQLRPHIYLTEEKPTEHGVAFLRTWRITNRSHVPAINVLVRYDKGHSTWSNWIQCFSLGNELVKEIPWVIWPDAIQVCYTDISKTRYYLYEMSSWTGDETEISREQYEANLAEAKKTFYTGTTSIINTNNLTDRLLRIINGRPINDDVENELNGLYFPQIFPGK